MKFNRQISVLLIVTIFLTMFFPVAGKATLFEPSNLVLNDSFEVAETATDTLLWPQAVKPQAWTLKPWKGYSSPAGLLDDGVFHSGAKSTKISMVDGRGTFEQEIKNIISGKTYVFKAWLKTQDITSNGIRIKLQQLDGNGTVISGAITDLSIITGTRDWSELSQKVTLTPNTKSVRIQLVLGVSGSVPKISGDVWIDEVSFTEEYIPVSSLSLDKENYIMKIGDNVTLNAEVLPTNATNKLLIWASDNENVAVVNQGVVAAIGEGVANITVSTSDGTFTKTCMVEVKKDIIIVPVTGISLNKENYTLQVGREYTLSASIIPEYATDKTVIWTSDNEGVATVEKGVVTALTSGSANITASTIDGQIKDSCIIKVEKPRPNMVPNGGYEEVVDNMPVGFSVWTPSGSPIIGIDENEKYSGNYSVKIEAPVETRTALKVANIPISGGYYKLSVAVKTLNVSASYGARLRYTINRNGGNVGLTQYSRNVQRSDDWDIVELFFEAPQDAKDIQILQFFETGTGTVWYDDLVLEPWVPVSDLNIIEDSISIKQGDERTLVPVFTPENASDKGVIWKSSDDTVVKVENGVIKGYERGTASITVETPDGKINDTCLVTVTGDLENGGFESVQPNSSLLWNGSVEPIGWSTENSGLDGIYTLDSQEPYKGLYSARIDLAQDKAIGNAQIKKQAQVLAEQSYRLSGKIKTKDFNGAAYLQVDNGDIRTNVITGSTEEWVEVESVFTVPQAVYSLAVEGKVENGIGTVWFDEIELEKWTPIQSITLEKSTLSIEQGKTVINGLSVSPITASDKNVIWESSNEAVASVVNGRITGVTQGNAIITARTKDNKVKAECTVVVTSHEWNEYDDLRVKWKDRLVGSALDLKDENILFAIAEIDTSANALWSSMDKSSSRTYIWPQYSNMTDSVSVMNSFRALETMAKAYATEGSSLEGNKELAKDIIEAMNWLYNNAYGQKFFKYYSWWNWEIGMPQSINNTITLVYDRVTNEEIQNFTDFIKYLLPDPYYSGVAVGNKRIAEGANLLDQVKVVTIEAILTNNGDRIALSAKNVAPSCEYTTQGNGIYTDGSLVQHEDIPYTASYGTVWLDGISVIVDLLNGSRWQIEDSRVYNMYNSVIDAFVPIIYKGAGMDMVRGRAISRYALQSHVAGHSIIDSILKMTTFVPEPYMSEYKSLVKYWLIADTYRSHLDGNKNINSIKLTKALMKDNSIVPKQTPTMIKEFANMDRTVQHTKNYAFGISKSSKRIQTFEMMNWENQKAWYTGDGMTYLYNNDLAQFDDDFWATVNYYRLPGTTVDIRTRSFGDEQKGDGEANAANSWSGGSTIQGLYGASGMNLIAQGSTLQANKSWFMFDDEIVAVGSGITSSDDRNIETIVEQRKINSTGDNVLTVNGEKKPNNLGWNEKIDNVNTIHLAGNVPGSNIGYLFSKPSSINALREVRSGAWSEINMSSSTPKDVRVRNYMSLWFDHGKSPTNATYDYAILPGKSAEELEHYAQNPDYKILANTEDIHAVKENRLNILAANFWSDNENSVDILKVNKRASVMIKQASDYLEVAVSDPTMENSGTIEVEIDKAVDSEILVDPAVAVLQMKPTIKLSINVNNTKGRSISAKFKINQESVPGGDNTTEPGNSFDIYESKDKGIVGINLPSFKSGFTTVATVKEKMFEQLIAKAKSQQVDENKKTIEVKILEESGSNSQKRFEIQMPQASLEGISKETEYGFGIDSSIARIRFDAEAVDSIYNQIAGSSNVCFGVSKLDIDELTEGEKQIINGRPAYEFSINAGESVISNFGKGSALVSLPYILKEGENPNFIVVYYLDQGGILKPVRGIYDSVNKVINIKLKHFSKYVVGYNSINFLDIPENEWFKDAVEYVGASGISLGTGDGNYKPYDKLTRAQFLVMIMRAYGVDLLESSDSNFKDAGNTYYTNYLATAKKLGITLGVGNNMFMPDKEITRQEMFTLLYNTLKVMNELPDITNAEKVLDNFEDASKVEQWARASLELFIKAEIVKGTGTLLEPQMTADRAQMAQIMYNLINFTFSSRTK